MALYFVIVDFDGGHCLHLTGPRVGERELQELAGSTGKVVGCFRFPTQNSDGSSDTSLEHLLEDNPCLKGELLGLLAYVIALGSQLPPLATREGDAFNESVFRVLLPDKRNLH